jgi:hypothetical protein
VMVERGRDEHSCNHNRSKIVKNLTGFPSYDSDITHMVCNSSRSFNPWEWTKERPNEKAKTLDGDGLGVM